MAEFRLTKKRLRETIRGVQKRVKDLGQLTDEQLLAELQRCFPGMTVSGGRPIEWMRVLVMDCIDRSFPPHWTE